MPTYCLVPANPEHSQVVNVNLHNLDTHALLLFLPYLQYKLQTTLRGCEIKLYQYYVNYFFESFHQLKALFYIQDKLNLWQ
ncbi:hypothetical protein AQUCO_02500111v1 [Aquilegia coerulea]|uniref:Uncharacterized protein n=1 Tax=Aquilegia coerulea TaxID=218851 RepID=A0A2G5D9N1_AQUCA|nr:hypothetical protein AQUCO_02500111v1 [Aquilegia coerulea]